MSACLLKHLSQDKLQVLELASRLECEIHLWAAAPAGSGDTPPSGSRGLRSGDLFPCAEMIKQSCG